ncbi:MAG: tetratricopeptide repeat protein [Mariprofundaceae bacterium]|nr:tetratricopeptide repeat protein [Mariprofundaceae bacterium]
MQNYLMMLILLLVTGCVPHQGTHGTTEKAVTAQHQATHAATPKKSAVDMRTMLSKKSDEFLYLSSKAALNDGDFNAAYMFLGILAKRSTQLSPQLELARLYIETKQGAKASALLQPWLRKFPVDASTIEHSDAVLLHQIYAKSLQVQGKNTEAITTLQAVLDSNPNVQSSRVYLVQLLLAEKQWKRAGRLVKESLAKRESAIMLNLQTDIALRQNNMKQARRSIIRLEALKPHDEQVTILHSGIENQSGHDKKSEAILRAFLTRYPSALQVAHRLGQFLIQQKRLDDAIEVYQGMLQYSKGVVEIYSTLSLLNYETKHYRQAADALIQALRLEPENEMFHFYLAVNQELLGELDSARQHYVKVSSTHERYAMSQLRVAAIAIEQKKLSEAESTLLAVLKEKPDYADGWGMLSAVYLQQEAYQKILDNTQPALTLTPVPNSLLLNRAVAYDHFKRYSDIDSTIQQLLQQSPDDAEALNFFGYSLAERGERLDEAEGYVQRALKQQPDNGFYLDSLAWIYYQRGVYSKAARIQRRALAKVKNIDPVMFDHLGDMLWRQGKQQAARQAWQDALSRARTSKRTALENKIRHGL